MKMNSRFKIYLAGACKCFPDGGKEWRKIAEKELKSYGIRPVTVFNPTKYFDYETHKHKTQRQIKSYYMSQLVTSDLVLVNLNSSDKSIGTAQEIQFAGDHNIPIVGFGVMDIYPWIYEDCQVVFDGLKEACEYIEGYYLDF